MILKLAYNRVTVGTSVLRMVLVRCGCVCVVIYQVVGGEERERESDLDWVVSY